MASAASKNSDVLGCDPPCSEMPCSSSRSGSARIPTKNIRSRRWGAPKSAARRLIHSMSYAPSEANADRHLSSPVEQTAGTFSRTKTLGRSTLIRSKRYQKRPDFSPSSPFCLPATEWSWHGQPAQMISVACNSSGLVCVMSV